MSDEKKIEGPEGPGPVHAVGTMREGFERGIEALASSAGPDLAASLLAQLARGRIVIEVLGERRRQDEKFGGPEHDDEHPLGELLSRITEHASDAWCAHARNNPDEVRRELVQTIAMGVATLESFDRRQAAPITPIVVDFGRELTGPVPAPPAPGVRPAFACGCSPLKIDLGLCSVFAPDGTERPAAKVRGVGPQETTESSREGGEECDG